MQMLTSGWHGDNSYDDCVCERWASASDLQNRAPGFMCAHLTQETQPSYYRPICSLHYSRSASKHNENVCHLWSSVIFGCTIYELETYTSHLRLDLIKSWGILFTSITCTSLRLYKLISVAQILHTLYTLATSFFTTACVLLTVIMHVTECSFDIHVHIV